MRVVDRVQQHVLVITLEADHVAGALLGEAPESADHVATLGAAVDVVAEQHKTMRPGARIFGTAMHQVVEPGEAAMHVTDGECQRGLIHGIPSSVPTRTSLK